MTKSPQSLLSPGLIVYWQVADYISAVFSDATTNKSLFQYCITQGTVAGTKSLLAPPIVVHSLNGRCNRNCTINYASPKPSDNMCNYTAIMHVQYLMMLYELALILSIKSIPPLKSWYRKLIHIKIL